MAESEGPKYKKYCLEYYYYKSCSNRRDCQYPHKSKNEIEAIGFVKGQDFVLGQIAKNPRPCYFYRYDKCLYQDKCRFLHDNDRSLKNMNDKTNNIGICNTMSNIESLSEPSTSNQNQSDIDPVTRNQACNNEIQMNSENKESEIDPDEVNKKNSTEEGACASPPLVISNNTNYTVQTSVSNVLGNDGNSAESVGEEGACASPRMVNWRNWADAPEFIPRSKPKSYAEVVSPESLVDRNANRRLCPYASRDGICMNLTYCNNLHGELCDMCERFVLHPYDEEERKRHRQECLKSHEKDMELSFAIQRSKEKACGVCFEIVMDKNSGEQRFGILPNCNHCFCLTCIRKWRQARQFENKIIRACPECRVTSDFVCPSMYWVDTKEEKDKLIDDYKKALSSKACKYFKRGLGKCPFGNKCFYMHAGPDGRIIDVGPPPRQRRRRNGDAELDVFQVMLWDFLDERDFPWQSLADDLEELVSFFTDSDESDWSDYDIFLD